MADNLDPNFLGHLGQGNLSRIGGLLSGPGRRLFDVSTHAPIQEAAKYPLFFKALGNLVGGRNTKAFDPIEAEARHKYHTETVPSIAERFAGRGSSGAEELAHHRAGVDLERGLAADRAKYGQEEERLRQSELEGLLKFGMQPTSEKIIMQPPEGGIPPTFEKNLSEVYGPQAKEVWANTQDWASRALKDLEAGAQLSPEALAREEEAHKEAVGKEKTYLGAGLRKGAHALKKVGRVVAPSVRAVEEKIVTPAREAVGNILKTTSRGVGGETAAEETANKEWINSAAGKKFRTRTQGSNVHYNFDNPQQMHQIDDILNRARVEKANQIKAFTKNNKKGLSFDAIDKFHKIAQNPLFNTNDQQILAALKALSSEESINKFFYLLSPENKNPARKQLPSDVANSSPYWRQMRQGKIPIKRG